MSPEYLIAITSAHGVSAVFTVPGTNRPDWTTAEAAQACAGLEDHIFAAMLYSYAGATEMYFRLKQELVRVAEETIERERFPDTVKRDGRQRSYAGDLAGMYLLEELKPWRFATAPNKPNMRRILMGIEEHTWRRRVSPVYEAIRTEYIYWLSDGRRQMNRWLRAHEDRANACFVGARAVNS